MRRDLERFQPARLSRIRAEMEGTGFTPVRGADDEWYESEEWTRKGMVRELQRMRRRMRVRPLPVLALAALITGALTFKLATRKPSFDAEIVLALREGTLGTQQHTGIPLGELEEFVSSVLLSDQKLEDL